LTTLKSAVFAPMPSVRAITAINVTAGDLIKMRAPNRTSCQKLFIDISNFCSPGLPCQNHLRQRVADNG
jgi:hypothetical protein